MAPTVPTSTAFSQDIFCQDCGYNLRGLTGERCPECGRSLAGLRSDVSQIPWVHRKEIGRFRAYWKTVWFVIVRTRLFGEEMARRVSYRDARSFQLVTVFLVFAAVVALLVSAYWLHPPGPVIDSGFVFSPTPGMVSGSSLHFMAYKEVWPMGIMAVCFLLYLLGVTVVHTYFFHPSAFPVEMQNRAVALSYYGCAPLAYFVLLVPMICDAIRQADNPQWLSERVVAVLAANPLLAIVWSVTITRIASQLMRPLRSRRIWLAILLLPIWSILAATTLVALPLAVLFPIIVIYSMP